MFVDDLGTGTKTTTFPTKKDDQRAESTIGRYVTDHIVEIIAGAGVSILICASGLLAFRFFRKQSIAKGINNLIFIRLKY